jgi:hypothetical protein
MGLEDIIDSFFVILSDTIWETWLKNYIKILILIDFCQMKESIWGSIQWNQHIKLLLTFCFYNDTSSRKITKDSGIIFNFISRYKTKTLFLPKTDQSIRNFCCSSQFYFCDWGIHDIKQYINNQVIFIIYFTYFY